MAETNRLRNVVVYVKDDNGNFISISSSNIIIYSNGWISIESIDSSDGNHLSDFYPPTSVLKICQK